MNTTDKSRADVLTEAQRKALETAVNVLNINWEHETANELWEAFTAPVSQPAAEPIDAPSVNETITYSGDSLTLSGAQLLEALDFIAPDRDADQLESEVTIQYGEGHTGKGMYCWCTEYPEEGAIFIDGSTAIPTEAAPAPSPADERAAFESLKGAWQSMPPFDVFCAGWQAARASSANETGAEGAPVAWMSIDDPRDCISDAKKRDMIEHAGAPGARLAEKYSIALGVITPAQAAEPCAWLVEWTPNVSDKVWAQSFVNELDAINKQRQVGGRIIACAPINALSHAPAQAAEPMPAPAGWKLVPVAPTFEMCRAMEEAIDAGWKDSIVWARGIAAAPQPPAQADAQSDKG